MSGPDYPRPKPAGSNAIGIYRIGVDPIGNIVPFDVWLTIISQYANSPRITKLITNWDTYIDQTANMTSFFDHIWNINTAEGYGLDVWGRIVGVNRVVQIFDKRYFGFEEQNNTTDPFNSAPYYSGEQLSDNFYLTDQSYRTLILAKAAANITNGSSQSINAILMNLFKGRGNTYVSDNLDMTMTYNFDFLVAPISPVEKAIVKTSGVLPKTTGVHPIYLDNGVPF